jgi:predicted phosphodiesterase
VLALEGASAMLRLIHVSDLHFTAHPEKNRASVQLLEDVRELIAPPDSKETKDHVVITGDIVNNGDEAEYAEALKAIEPFKGRLLLVPGNHDYGGSGIAYEAERARRFEEKLLVPLGIRHSFVNKEPAVSVLTDGAGVQVLMVGLNSNKLTPEDVDFARGRIGEQQMAKLDRILSNPEHRGLWKVVYLHCQARKGPDFALELEDGEQLVAMLRNRVHVAAFGHHAGGPPAPNFPVEPADLPVTAPRDGHPYLLNANLCVQGHHCMIVNFEHPMTPGAYPRVERRQFR